MLVFCWIISTTSLQTLLELLSNIDFNTFLLNKYDLRILRTCYNENIVGICDSMWDNDRKILTNFLYGRFHILEKLVSVQTSIISDLVLYDIAVTWQSETQPTINKKYRRYPFSYANGNWEENGNGKTKKGKKYLWFI